MKFITITGLLLQSTVSALLNPIALGIQFENGNDDVPILNLDYAKYSGTYNKSYDVFVFKNIRFAAPPLGELRWAKPAPPVRLTGVQDGSEGRSCIQSGGGARSGMPITVAGEDCLFLDITVPSRAVRDPTLRLPVVVWFHGGAYVVGSKEQRGNAEAMVRASGGNIIWVAGNYRLGAYGFLTGTTVEKEAIPNVGFWDQRAVLEWIQKNIRLVGGDNRGVTAMGISAGAGSVLHHLALDGGKVDPLFTKAIIQSPGYTNFQDRAGAMEQNYKRFENFAGCKDKGIACLRALDEATLKTASDKANSGQRQGSFAFGPAPDGKFIVNTPTLEFAAGRYFKGIESIISSHVTDEGGAFADSEITDDAKFTQLVNLTYGKKPELAWVLEKINQIYPPLSAPGSVYKTQRERYAHHVTEGSFTCHNRIVADAYPGKVYSIQYAVPPATHGSDQSGTFFNPLAPQNKDLPEAEVVSRQGFQSYLISFARSGNPNTHRNKANTIDWPSTAGANSTGLLNVLRVDNLNGASGLSLIDNDPLQLKLRCQFWSDIQKSTEKSFATSV